MPASTIGFQLSCRCRVSSVRTTESSKGRLAVSHLRVPGRCGEKRHLDGLVGTQLLVTCYRASALPDLTRTFGSEAGGGSGACTTSARQKPSKVRSGAW